MTPYQTADSPGVRRTVETTVRSRVGRKPTTVTITKLRSDAPFLYEIDGRTVLVDAVTITDYGPRDGASTVYTEHTDYTEEERRAGRAQIQRAVNDVMHQLGRW